MTDYQITSNGTILVEELQERLHELNLTISSTIVPLEASLTQVPIEMNPDIRFSIIYRDDVTDKELIEVKQNNHLVYSFYVYSQGPTPIKAVSVETGEMLNSPSLLSVSVVTADEMIPHIKKAIQ